MRGGGVFGMSIIAAAITLAVVASPASAGSLSGVVTDASTGDPIDGIQVTGWRQATPIESVGATDVTDASGHYSLADLPTADYAVQVLPVERNYVAEYFDGKRTEEEADLVHVDAGEARSGIDVSLEPGGRVTGQVRAALSGIPLSGVSVCASSQTDFTGGCGVTDGAGNYVVEGLPTDSYIVSFSPSWSLNYFESWYGGATDYEDATWFPVVEGQTTSGIDGELQESAGISGSLTDAENGEPVADIEVCAIGVGGEEFPRCSSSGPDGRYLVGGMPSGQYRLAFSPEHERDLGEGEVQEDGYFAQYYREVSTRAAAAIFSLDPPSLTAGIDARLRPKQPHPLRPGPTPTPVPLVLPKPRPTTYIVAGGAKIRSRSAKFRFVSNPFGHRFECRLDRRAWSRCISPKVYRHLGAGKHVFEVRAVDPEGRWDLSPARFGKFTIR